MNNLLTIEQAASHLKSDSSYVWSLILQGKLRNRGTGRQILLAKADQRTRFVLAPNVVSGEVDVFPAER
jgi:hypothetical protein